LRGREADDLHCESGAGDVFREFDGNLHLDCGRSDWRTYSFDAQATGTDSHAITHDALVTLYVVDFNLTAPSPNALSVAQGGTSGASKFQVTASGSFAGRWR